MTIRLSVSSVLRFFDEKPNDSVGHATSIVSLVGEDLATGLFNHFLEQNEHSVKVIEQTPTTGKRKGPRLDRWIQVNLVNGGGTLFQTEIKNWSAHAIGGRKLPRGVEKAVYRDWAMNRWSLLWNENNIPRWPSVQKVLHPMKPKFSFPEDFNVEPLLIFWYTLHPEGRDEFFFYRTLPNDEYFNRVWIFSMSAYLRSLKEEYILVNFPNVQKRIKWINSMFHNQEK